MALFTIYKCEYFLKIKFFVYFTIGDISKEPNVAWILKDVWRLCAEKKDKLFDNQYELFKTNKILMKRETLKNFKCNE